MARRSPRRACTSSRRARRSSPSSCRHPVSRTTFPGEIVLATRTNLSELALRNSTLTVFFMLALTIAGIYAFFSLGRAEDPPFTIKQMVVSAAWPGATSREVEQQVTDKIETKLQELPYFYNVTSYTKPGETVIYVSLRSEEHTPELQSPVHLVCRLLLEKKKPDGDLHHGGVHRVGRVHRRRAAFDVVHARALVGADQRALDLAQFLGVDPEVGLQRHVDVHAGRHVDERATRPHRVVEGGELVVVAGDDFFF